MLRFLLELIPCLGLGLLLGMRFPGLPGRLAPPLITWGIPISLVALLLRSGFQAELLTAALMAAAASGLGLLLLRLPALGRCIPEGSLQLGCVVGNTAYWGLPVALALLPPEAIGFTIAFDLMATLITWSLGPLLVDRRATGVRRQLQVLATSPAMRGLALAVLLHQTPWSAVLAQWLWWPARLVVLVALALVGMRLGLMLRRRPAGTAGPAGGSAWWRPWWASCWCSRRPCCCSPSCWGCPPRCGTRWCCRRRPPPPSRCCCSRKRPLPGGRRPPEPGGGRRPM